MEKDKKPIWNISKKMMKIALIMKRQKCNSKSSNKEKKMIKASRIHRSNQNFRNLFVTNKVSRPMLTHNKNTETPNQ